MTTMLDHTRAVLEQQQAFTQILNPHIQQIVDAIPYTNVSLPMKSIIAATQLTSFVSHFRRNILLWDGTQVPINAISFVVTGSGGGKDSSVNAARKCFSESLHTILTERERREVKRAIAKAIAEGEDESAASAQEIYRKYLRPLPPVDIAPTTGPGLIQHINDIGDLDLTTGLLYSGEFSDELAYNQDIMENIKILSETYDLGNKEAKYTKGVEHRSKSIQSQAVSALFVGSPGHILYDEATKKKFHIAFMSKLARRSWFCYAPERIPEPDFLDHADPILAMLDYHQDLDDRALASRQSMLAFVEDITKFGIATAGKTIGVSADVRKLFEVYKRFNSDLADTLPNQDSTSALIRRHLQWKCLKLAGALAIFDKSNTIETSHYIDAIRFAEMYSTDMERFEYDLNKAPHERFSDFIRTQVQVDGRAIINVHDLKKNNFISTVSTAKLQELVHLCTGYDATGIYSIINEGGAIAYEPIIKTEIVNIAYKPIHTAELNRAITAGDIDLIRSAKHAISVTTAYGFENASTSFDDLSNLLEGDFAYSPFHFRNGVRSKDNIAGGAKFLVFDIDDSPISASEAHFLLADLNHHIALSSDPSNEFKFRVLLELDTFVDLSPVAWKAFCAGVADDLGLRIDSLPQSQIFFSYAGRPVLSNLGASPLITRPYIIAAKEREVTKELRQSVLSVPQKTALLSDPLTTFAFAFESQWGAASRNVIRAMLYAKDLGADTSYAIDLFNQIQDYWEVPFDKPRQEAMLAQITRIYRH